MRGDVSADPAIAVLFRDGVDLSWQDRALCAETNPDEFFPNKGRSTKEAKRVCAACEVRAECLNYALENGEAWGIWGGLAPRERQAIRREHVPATRPVVRLAEAGPPRIWLCLPCLNGHCDVCRRGKCSCDRIGLPPAIVPVPVAIEAPAPERCPACGYAVTAPGHKITCEDDQ